MIWPKDKLTRFEVARILGARSLQISLGAPLLIKTDKTDPIEIAKLEFRSNLIPMTIKRELPSGQGMTVEIKKAIQNWLDTYKGEV